MLVGACVKILLLFQQKKSLEKSSIKRIKQYAEDFKLLARSVNKNNTFIVTRVGCGLAGYTDEDIAPLFKDSPTNCWFHYEWEKYLE